MLGSWKTIVNLLLCYIQIWVRANVDKLQNITDEEPLFFENQRSPRWRLSRPSGFCHQQFLVVVSPKTTRLTTCRRSHVIPHLHWIDGFFANQQSVHTSHTICRCGRWLLGGCADHTHATEVFWRRNGGPEINTSFDCALFVVADSAFAFGAFCGRRRDESGLSPDQSVPVGEENTFLV